MSSLASSVSTVGPHSGRGHRTEVGGGGGVNFGTAYMLIHAVLFRALVVAVLVLGGVAVSWLEILIIDLQLMHK